MSEPLKVLLGRQIRQLREAREWSLSQLASKVKRSKANVAHIEVGRYEAAVARYEELARALGGHLVCYIVSNDADAALDNLVEAAAGLNTRDIEALTELTRYWSAIPEVERKVIAYSARSFAEEAAAREPGAVRPLRRS